MMKIFAVLFIIWFTCEVLYMLAIMPRMIKRPRRAPFQGVYYAHRGFHDNRLDAPENSLKAFKRAVQKGYGIELDIQLSKDKIPVVFHDFTLDRMCGIKGKVNEYTFAQLQQFKLGSSEERIPSLAQVLELVDGKVPLIVELKIDWTDLSLCPIADALLREYKGIYCVESFNPLGLLWYRKHKKRVMRGQLSDAFEKDKNKKLQAILYWALENLLFNFLTKPDFIAYNYRFYRNKSRAICRYVYGGLAVAWTIQSQEDLNQRQEDFDLFIFDSFTPEEKTMNKEEKQQIKEENRITDEARKDKTEAPCANNESAEDKTHAELLEELDEYAWNRDIPDVDQIKTVTHSLYRQSPEEYELNKEALWKSILVDAGVACAEAQNAEASDPAKAASANANQNKKNSSGKKRGIFRHPARVAGIAAAALVMLFIGLNTITYATDRMNFIQYVGSRDNKNMFRVTGDAQQMSVTSESELYYSWSDVPVEYREHLLVPRHIPEDMSLYTITASTTENDVTFFVHYLDAGGKKYLDVNIDIKSNADFSFQTYVMPENCKLVKEQNYDGVKVQFYTNAEDDMVATFIKDNCYYNFYGTVSQEEMQLVVEDTLAMK